jgi:hypothetical protein
MVKAIARGYRWRGIRAWAAVGFRIGFGHERRLLFAAFCHGTNATARRYPFQRVSSPDPLVVEARRVPRVLSAARGPFCIVRRCNQSLASRCPHQQSDLREILPGFRGLMAAHLGYVLRAESAAVLSSINRA